MRHWFGILIALAGCTELSGAGEYRVGGDDRADVEVDNPCGTDEVLTDRGTCEHVGVPVEICAQSGFELAPDGACAALMPAEDCEWGLAFPGSTTCDATLGVPTCDDNGYPSRGAIPEASVTYVDPEFTSDCATRGSIDCPFSTIGAALDPITDGTGRFVFLRNHTYEEDVVISVSGLEIRGCPGKAIIVGQKQNLDPSQPCSQVAFESARSAAICIDRSSTGVTIEGVRVTGPGVGMRALGAQAVLRNSEVVDTGSYGIEVMESKADMSPSAPVTPADLTLDRVAVLRAGGAGVVVYGSKLTVDQSSIQNTRMLNAPPAEIAPLVREGRNFGWARGIAVYPSMWATDVTTAGPDDFLPSTVNIQGSAITGHEEVAVFASGATLVMEDTFIGGLPEGAPAGRGLVIERSIAVGTPVQATIERSIIDGTRDAAIDVRDGALVVRDTTIRNTFARRLDGCSGQGIRIRSLPVGEDQSSAEIDRSSVLDSRQAGVFAASSSVRITDSVIRGVSPQASESPCTRAMGDGIDAESYPGAIASSLVLNKVRIEGATRAAVSAGAGEVSVKSTTLVCNERDLVDATGLREASTATGAACGCNGGTFRRCGLVPEVLDSWARIGPSDAWPDANVSYLFCAEEYGGVRPLPGGAVWGADSPEIVPVELQQDGCALLGGAVPGVYENIVLWTPGFNPWAIVQMLDTPGVHSWQGSTAPVALFAQSGYPTGVPVITVSWPPSGSVFPDVVLLDMGGNPLPDGRVPGNIGQMYPLVFLVPPEPGWYAITIEPPAGSTCVTNPVYTRVEQGLNENIWFDCTLPLAQ